LEDISAAASLSDKSAKGLLDETSPVSRRLSKPESGRDECVDAEVLSEEGIIIAFRFPGLSRSDKNARLPVLELKEDADDEGVEL
jgi:hypothetical protein